MATNIQLLLRAAKLRNQAIKEKLSDKDFYLNLDKQNHPEIWGAEQEHKKSVTLTLPATVVAAPEIPTLNAQQQKAVDLALSGNSFVLIGSAGTGKTFTVRYILESLIKAGKLPYMTVDTKTLKKGDYGFLATAYTRRAASVVRKNLPVGLSASTIHAALEYAPEKYMDYDGAGNLVSKFRFTPTRHKSNPIPNCLRIMAIDESSMCGLDLHSELMDAMPHRPQMIYIGDLAQLPPVFGDAILGYKLSELPVVELTEVYRQKEGEILDFATDIRNGKQILNFAQPQYKNERLMVRTFANLQPDNIRLAQMGAELQRHVAENDIDPLAGDLILCPFNVGIGCIELNKYVADYYDQANSRKLFHVIAGHKNLYLAIGDKILIDRNDCIITDIQPNPKYYGKLPTIPTVKINRWGAIRAGKYMPSSEATDTDTNPDQDTADEFELALMRGLSLEEIDESEDRKQEASHVIYYEYISPDLQQKVAMQQSLDRSNSLSVQSAGDVNKVELAYCISVHKSQGSQADHVLLILLNQHRKMASRELLYTAVTRAAKRLTIYTDKGVLNKAINSPEIKGNTWQDKAEVFKGKKKERKN